MSLCQVVMVACLAVFGLAACSEPATPAPVGPSYSCCEAKDIETVYRPGQTLALHWLVTPGEVGAPARHLELAARLTGPFGSVDDLKATTSRAGHAAGRVTFSAATVRPTGEPRERPVSSIAISPEAEPGYYDLISSVTEGGGTVSGETIIQVTAKA